jgi:hypothetical protein
MCKSSYGRHSQRARLYAEAVLARKTAGICPLPYPSTTPHYPWMLDLRLLFGISRRQGKAYLLEDLVCSSSRIKGRLLQSDRSEVGLADSFRRLSGL